MSWRCGSLSRSLFSAARKPYQVVLLPTLSLAFTALPRLHFTLTSSTVARCPSVIGPRTMGPPECTYLLMPLHSAVADARLTSHLLNRAFATSCLRVFEWLNGRK